LWYWERLSCGSAGLDSAAVAFSNSQVGLVLLNADFAAALDAVGAILTTYLIERDQSYMETIFNGAPGGLVAVFW
jgi:ammonia channel protein AmtB